MIDFLTVTDGKELGSVRTSMVFTAISCSPACGGRFSRDGRVDNTQKRLIYPEMND